MRAHGRRKIGTRNLLHSDDRLRGTAIVSCVDLELKDGGEGTHQGVAEGVRDLQSNAEDIQALRVRLLARKSVRTAGERRKGRTTT